MSTMTSFQTNLANAKIALAKKNKFTDYRGLNTKKNYSSFWMDDKWDTASKFGGISTKGSQSSDLVKSVKLANYRRAVTNFVKIVTKKDIPVLFEGTDSHTNGKSITLSTDIKDSNFDVTVGLALHESSHIILTDFALLGDLYAGKCDVVEQVVTKYLIYKSYGPHTVREYIKQMLNWIEDRRIDNYVFSTSPGYKAYYHKLYDYYWNSKDVLKGFIGSQLRDATKYDSYEFHVINMINPNFNPNALPGLDKIAALIDLPNINRLQSTAEALAIAAGIVDLILMEVTDPENAQKQQAKQAANQSTDESTDESASGQNVPQQSAEGGEEGENDDSRELTPSEQSAVEKALNQQRKFLNGFLGKKSATKKLQNQLDKVAKQDVEIQSIGGENSIDNQSALMYDYTNSAKMGTFMQLADLLNKKYVERDNIPLNNDARHAIQDEIRSIRTEMEATGLDEHLGYNRSKDTAAAIQKGLDMGALLGKKLQMHNEVRERVDNRLRSGKVDNRRLAHAGYGIESVFSQISIDAYKKANLHISLDGSGSMHGSKWEATIQMTMAIAKAVSYTQNIDLQVSIRVTAGNGRGDVASNLMMYDSRKNKLNHLVTLLSQFYPKSMTPEGLCFEAMMKKGLLVTGDVNRDSYFLNISDGEPGMNGYQGTSAINHTAAQVKKMRSQYNISVISFWIEGGYNNNISYEQLVSQFASSRSGSSFRTMYGKDASVVDSNNALMIAKELNKKFLTK